MAEQMMEVELGYIDRLASKQAISTNLAKTLRRISENRFNFTKRRGSGEVPESSHYNDYTAVDHSVKNKVKKINDPSLSAIHIEAKQHQEIDKHERRQSKVSYFKGGGKILNDPSYLNIVTDNPMIQPSQSVLSNIVTH